MKSPSSNRPSPLPSIKQLRRELSARKAKILRAARRAGVLLDPHPTSNGRNGTGNGRK